MSRPRDKRKADVPIMFDHRGLDETGSPTTPLRRPKVRGRKCSGGKDPQWLLDRRR